MSSTNDHFVIADNRGRRVILRCYRQRPDPHTALTRLRRERWVLRTLRAAGAPVTEVLASSEETGAVALLLEFAEGELLGSLLGRLPPFEAAAAWSAAGRALAAVHAVDNTGAAAAGCERAGYPRSGRIARAVPPRRCAPAPRPARQLAP